MASLFEYQIPQKCVLRGISPLMGSLVVLGVWLKEWPGGGQFLLCLLVCQESHKLLLSKY